MKIGNIVALVSLHFIVVLSLSGQLSAATLISTSQSSEDCAGEGCAQPALYTDSSTSACATSAQGSTRADCAPQGLMYVNQTAYAAADKDSDTASPQADEGKLSIPGSFLASVLAIIGIVAVARRDVSRRGGDGNE